jgi:Spy/CpxP family protein refolding chaperone
MKKAVWTAMAIVAIAAMIPVAAAQGPQGRGGRGPGGGFGGPGGPGGGPGGRGGPGGPAAILHQLNLTDAQREQLKAIHEERREERPGANMMELQKQLQTALFADTVDLAKIEELKTAIASAEAAMLSARIDTELKINQILTAEQRAKARDLLAKGPGQRGRRGN